MALPNYLAQIKSSGIYRFVWDKSQIPGVDVTALRLVVGFSEKGHFNTLVYVDSPEQFKTIYGDVNKKLERQGVFFHRNALQCLREGPIFCLNLKPFKGYGKKNPDAEYTSPATPEQVTSFSFDCTTNFASVPSATPYIWNLFETNRFWTLEPEKLDEVTYNSTDPAKYINIASTDDKLFSKTFVIRGAHPRGYHVTFKNYFEQTLNGTEMPSYLEGYENEFLDDYFATVYIFNGQFTNEFKSSPNMVKYFDQTTYEMKATIPNAFGDEVDTLTVMTQDANTGFVNSYTGILLPDFVSPASTALSLDNIFNSDNDLHKCIMHLNEDLLYNETITLDNVNTTGWKQTMDGNGVITTTNTIDVLSATGANPGNQNLDWTSADVKPGTDTHVQYIMLGEDSSGISIDPNEYNPYDGDLASASLAVVGKDTIEETQNYTNDPDKVIPMLSTKFNLKEGDRFVFAINDENSNPVKVISTLSKITISEIESNSATVTYKFSTDIVKTDDTTTDLPNDGAATPVYCLVKCISGISDGFQSYKDLYLQGYTYASIAWTTSTNPLTKAGVINDILDVLNYKGIFTALTNNVDSEYHYLVDTFTSYEAANIKDRMAMVAKDKDNCLALLNWPSFKTWRAILGDGFSWDDVAQEYRKCSAENQSWVEYITPMIMKNPYTGTKFEVPSAALVSNDYVQKFADRFPYSIVAGPNFAVLSDPDLVGPDYNYSREELNILEPFGINCLVYKPRKGTYVNSQQTAKQNPVTTLSKVNVREIVIYLQDEIEKILQDYQWEFNTQSLRETVKGRADALCEQAKCNGGLYRYYNVCDTSNNTDDVINNEMFVISTSIEPGMGAGKMVQELTLYRKGGMKSVIVEE